MNFNFTPSKADKSRMRLVSIAKANPQSIPDILNAIKHLADDALKNTLDVAQRQMFAELRSSVVLLERQYKRRLDGMLGDLKKLVKEEVGKVEPRKGEQGAKGDMWSKEEVLALILEVMPELKDGKDGFTPSKEDIMAVARPIILAALTDNSVISGILREKDAAQKKMSDEAFGLMQKFVYEEVNKLKRVGGGYAGDRVKAGEGVEITMNAIGQKVISSSGSGAVETPTGAVNGSNTDFTVTATPKWIVADGITYYEDAGYTLDGLDVTMDIPPSQYIRAIR